MRKTLQTVFSVLAFAATVAAVGPGTARAAVPSYTGCLSPILNAVYDVAPGDAPAHPPCRQPASVIHLSSGDLTSLAAGTGLTGGGGNGDLSVAIAPSYRLPQSCSAGQTASWNGTNWACAAFVSQAEFNSLVALLGTPGTINDGSNPVHWTKLKGVPAGFADGTDDTGPSYSAGFGLNLTGTTFSADPAQLQHRVTETCTTGSAIRAVHDDGTVACETISSGGSGWSLTGNTGTSSTNFIGTTDDQPLNLKVNGQRGLRLEPRPESPNLVGGSESNATGVDAYGATIAGGGTSTFPNVVNGPFSTLGGGLDNSAEGVFSTVAGGAHNVAEAGDATVSGGANNVASNRATVSGGEANEASGFASMIPGGQFNHATGDYSFAAGVRAHADHQGSFVWGDLTDEDISSTGPNQFVVRAHGGLHLSGGPLVCLGCVTGGDLAGSGVSTDKLADGAVTEGKLGFDPTTQVEFDSLTQLLRQPGSVNDAGNPVEWTKLKGVPSGFADGVDNVSVAAHPVPMANQLTTIDSDSPDVGRDTSITTGPDGLGLISYTDVHDGSLKVAHCSDAECSTAATWAFSDIASALGAGTSITIGADGLGLISYLGSPSHDLKVAHCSDAECSETSEPSTLDTTGQVGYESSITVGADGFGLISYYDATSGNLKVAHCSNPACSAATKTTLDISGSSIVGRYTSITTGADGLGLISYQDETHGDLKVAHCSNVTCSAATTWIVDSAFDLSLGQYTSITVGVDGLGLISYYDLGNDDLRVAHCSNVLCSAATHSTLDGPETVGQYTSITIGLDGLGLVSYYDAGSGDLKVAHCANTTCSTGSSIAVDTGGDVGSYGSITSGGDGLGLVAYYDSTNHHLKVAHLSNPFGAPYFRRR